MNTKKESTKKRQPKKKQKKHFKPPTLEQIEKFIEKHRGIRIYPEYVYKFFAARRWKDINGKRIKGIPSMVYYLNGQLLSSHPLPPINPPKKLKKTSKPKKEKWTTYEEQLQDPRWFEFRERVFAARGMKCEHCGAIAHLQVHHPKYITGRKAWEYSTDEVRVLCRSCHKKEHGLDEEDA